MLRSVLLASAIALAAPLAAQTATPPAVVATTPDAALADFFVTFDKAQLARSPTSQSYRGIKTDYDKWDDGTDAAAIEDHKAAMAALAEMTRRFGPPEVQAKLSADSKLSYWMFQKVMARRDAGFRFRHDRYVYDQMNGAQSEYPAFLINIHQVKTKSDAQAYAARLEKMGTAIDQDIAESQRRAALGTLPPKWVFPYVIEDARNTIKGAPFDGSAEDSPLLADFKAKVGKLDIADADKAALIARGTKALTTVVKPAYERLIAAVQAQEKAAGTIDGVWRFKDGKAFYTAQLANYTTTNLTGDQIHALGLQQVARIHGEMMDVAKRMGFKGDLKAFLAQMRTDKQYILPEGEASKAEWLRRANAALADIGTKLPNYFENIPKSALTVKAVEPFREKSAGKAFYQSPAEDGSRPGTVYVNLYKLSDMPTTEIEALIYHEGMPGHHFERASSTELKNVPPFRKFGGNSAYSEGWGLYSEKLAKEIGQYKEPSSDFGRLQLELHRAIRLVVDSGIHGSQHWSREQAVKYTLDNSAETPGSVQKAIERYTVFPGQATAYMIGRLKIMELRDRAQKALGPKFDIKGFHTVVLKTGAVPLDILEENVDAWIAAGR